jgi:hypothetical protein
VAAKKFLRASGSRMDVAALGSKGFELIRTLPSKAWNAEQPQRDEETQHLLRLLEIAGRTGVEHDELPESDELHAVSTFARAIEAPVAYYAVQGAHGGRDFEWCWFFNRHETHLLRYDCNPSTVSEPKRSILSMLWPALLSRRHRRWKTDRLLRITLDGVAADPRSVPIAKHIARYFDFDTPGAFFGRAELLPDRWGYSQGE